MDSPGKFPLPAYAVPGIEPARLSEEGRQIEYRGDQLIRTPPVAAVLARTPEAFLPLVVREEEDLSREGLCENLDVTSQDGQRWEVGLGDAVMCIVDTSSDLVDDDLIEEALAAQPDVVEVYHMDREVFEHTSGAHHARR